MRQVPPKSTISQNDYQKETPESPDGKFGAFTDDDNDDEAVYQNSEDSSSPDFVSPQSHKDHSSNQQNAFNINFNDTNECKQLTPIIENESCRTTFKGKQVIVNQQEYASFRNIQIEDTIDFQAYMENSQENIQKSNHQEERKTVEAEYESQQHITKLKQSVEYLFLYYCDYSIDKGSIFIKQSNLMKLLKDAKLIKIGFFTIKDINLLVSQEMANPMQKSLDFQSFLNIIVKIALIKDDQQDPKVALAQMLDQHIMPLLINIETAIMEQNQMKVQSQVTQNGQYIANISLNTLQEIEISDEDILIFKALDQVLKELYMQYFPIKLKEHAMKKLFRFLKDFDICPYLLNQKTCFMIYYFTAIFETDDESLQARMDEISMKQTKKNHKQQQLQEDKSLTYDQFLRILHRASIIFADINAQAEKTSSKKLLSMLTRLEMTKGFTEFAAKVRQSRPVDALQALTPPQNVLVQLIVNEQHFSSQQELEYYREEELLSHDNYTLCKIYLDSKQLSGKDFTKQQQEKSLQLRQDQELEIFLDQYDEKLQQIFQFYCSYGDPMNTSRMKSAKFIKLLTDAGLIQSKSINLNASIISKKGMKSHRITPTKLLLDRNEIDLVFKKVAAQRSSNNGIFTSKIQQHNKSSIINSQTLKPPNTHVKVKTIELNVDQTYLDFDKFKTAIQNVSKLLPRIDFINFLTEYILPLHSQQKDEKHLYSQKIASMLVQLESDEVLQLLSDLYQVMYTIYEIYANHKQLMDFTTFSKFSTHFSICPDVVSKSELYRVFMNLASPNNETPREISVILDKSTTSTSFMQFNTPNNKVQHMLDSHLFIQALAFCALHLSLDSRILPENQSGQEKLLLFIEKLGLSEGIRNLKKSNNDQIKSIGKVERLDILGVFRIKYSSYFEMKKTKMMMERSMKVQKSALQVLMKLDQTSKQSGMTERNRSHLRSNRHQLESSRSQNRREMTPMGSSAKKDLFGMVLSSSRLGK